MKNNLMKYLREFGDRSFREMPFSEVDALTLALLVYMKFDGIVPGFNRGAPMSWEDIRKKPGWEHMFSDPVYGASYREAFELISKSRRYGRIRVNYFVEWIDEEREAQFAAITFFLGKGSVFVAFRGTDERLVGWKEDFNMSFLRLVPSQKRALDYVKGVARYTSGRLVLGGHSKAAIWRSMPRRLSRHRCRSGSAASTASTVPDCGDISMRRPDSCGSGIGIAKSCRSSP